MGSYDALTVVKDTLLRTAYTRKARKPQTRNVQIVEDNIKHRQGVALYELVKHSESTTSMLIDLDFTKQVRA